MTAHDHATLVPGCFRCDLSEAEQPPPAGKGDYQEAGVVSPPEPTPVILEITVPPAPARTADLCNPEPAEESTLEVLRRQRRELDGLPTAAELMRRIHSQLHEIQRLDRVIIDLQTERDQYRQLYQTYKAVSEGQTADIERLKEADAAHVRAFNAISDDLTRLKRRSEEQVAVVHAARAFVEHHKSPQPWQLGKRQTDEEWAKQEAWHDEDQRLIAALVAAVTAMPEGKQ